MEGTLPPLIDLPLMVISCEPFKLMGLDAVYEVALNDAVLMCIDKGTSGLLVAGSLGLISFFEQEHHTNKLIVKSKNSFLLINFLFKFYQIVRYKSRIKLF